MTQATASPEELAKFEAVASDWWDPNGPMKPLHQMNPARISYMQRHTDITGQKWLDVGCGGGLLSEAVSKLGADVTAIDPCAELIGVAKQHADKQSLSIDYQAIELNAHPQQATYDVISCMELLEHVDKPDELLDLCRPLLKANGTLFLSTLNRNWTSFLLGIVAAEYVLGLVPRGTHRYQQFIKPSELQKWLTNAGFVLTDISGMSYNPIDNSCQLSDDVSVNYIIQAKLADTA
jgi:2-polyprenyl-6-hydroxyphenyl methylase / 3-demethylubiquinone-9 3-methyltransferase